MNIRPSLRGAAAIVLTLAALSGCGDHGGDKTKAEKAPAKGATNARVVTVARVEARGIEGGVSAPGVLISREEAAVSAEVTGYRVAKVLSDVGAYVKAGQTLVELDDTLLRGQIEQAQALLSQAEVAARQADAQAGRVRGLEGQGVMSDEQIADRRFAAETAKAQVAAQAATLADLKARQARMIVRSPVSGLILERTVRPGDLSGTGAAPMFRIARDNLIELEAQLAESNLAAVRPGQPALVTLPGGQTLSGRVRIITPTVDPQTKLGGVRIALPVNSALRPGGYAQASFGGVGAQGTAVPEKALRYDADGVSVMVVGDGNKVSRAPVRVGQRGGGWVQLLQGPPVGSRILLGASSFVLEGDVVKPVEQGAR